MTLEQAKAILRNPKFHTRKEVWDAELLVEQHLRQTKALA